jgi:hypothetical protein
MDASLNFARWTLVYGWEHYWARVLLVVLMAALTTFIAGGIARFSGAFRLDNDDIRSQKTSKTSPEYRSDRPDILPLPSQEPEESKPQ